MRRVQSGRDDLIILELAAPADKLCAGRVDQKGEVQIIGYASDLELPELTPGVAGRLMVYRFHRRAVVLTDDRVIRSIHQNRASAVAVQFSQVAELCGGFGTTVARVLTHPPSRVELAFLPGRTFHDLGGDTLPGWRRFAKTWPGLAARPVGPPEHTGADRANVP